MSKLRGWLGGLWRPLLIAAAGVAAYHNSFGGVFLMDDLPTLQTAMVRDPLLMWPQYIALRDDVRVVALATLAANRALGGFDPWGYHAVNLGIHLAAALALYGVTRQTLALPGVPDRYRAAAPNLALAVAAIWVVHPLTTQAVTYVVQRMESLMALFYLLTLYALNRGATADRGRRLWDLAAVLACALGMASKEVTVSAPVAALLYDRCFLAGSFAGALRRRWPLYLGLAATWVLLLPLFVFLTAPAAATRGATVGLRVEGMPPEAYARSQPGVIVHYLRLSAWPYRLNFDPHWPIADTPDEIVPPAVVVGGLLALTLWALWRWPRVGFLGAAFFLVLAPTSSVVPVRDLMYEYRMYLPLAAVITLAVLAGADLVCRLPGRAVVGPVLVATAVVAFGVITIQRNETYRSGAAMWADVLDQVPDHLRARLSYGNALIEEGRPAEAEAVARALLGAPTRFPGEDPGRAGPHNLLGRALMAQGRLDEALPELEAAVELWSWNGAFLRDLVIAQAKAGL